MANDPSGVKSKRVCTGYEVNSPADHVRMILPEYAAYAALAVLRNPSLLPWDMNQIEADAFDFFRHHTIYELPGTSRTLYWDRLTLAASHSETAVTHAVMALAAVDRAKSQPTVNPYGLALPDRQQYKFALDQYNLAVGQLRGYIARLPTDGCADASVETVLLLSLLFFCFDVLQAQDESACVHLRTGLRILYHRIGDTERDAKAQRRQNTSTSNKPSASNLLQPREMHTITLRSTPRNNLDLLAQTFYRLDNDLLIAADDAAFLTARGRPIPKSFFSLDEALVHLDVLSGEMGQVIEAFLLAAQEHRQRTIDLQNMDEAHRSLHLRIAARTVPIAPELNATFDQLRQDVLAWMSAHAQLRWTKEDEAMHMLTNISFYFIWTTVMHLRGASEMDYDKSIAQADHILGLCERYLAISSKDKASPPKCGIGNRSRCCMTAGTNIPVLIFEIASQCRDSAIRSRCINLLRSLNLKGLLDEYYISALLEHIVDLEESMARNITGDYTTIQLQPKDIPAAARILDLELCLELGSGVTKYNFYKQNGGRMIYATCANGRDGEIRVDETWFTVDRPTLSSSGESSPTFDESLLNPLLLDLSNSA